MDPLAPIFSSNGNPVDVIVSQWYGAFLSTDQITGEHFVNGQDGLFTVSGHNLHIHYVYKQFLVDELQMYFMDVVTDYHGFLLYNILSEQIQFVFKNHVKH